MKIVKVLKGLAWWVVLIAVLAFSLCFALPSFFKKEQATDYKTVVTIWNVDTFEGGKGSRTAFLNAVAKEVEKEESVIFMVLSKTLEGAQMALENGEMPDLLSFGPGIRIAASNKVYCWCMGKYALFTKRKESGRNAEPNSKNTVLSLGGKNLPTIAAALSGFSGDLRRENSLEAYVRFLNGDFAYLLGTQRDAQRLISRGVEVDATSLNDFTDLKQYITALKVENKKLGQVFIDCLLSERIQRKLTTIGMFSENYSIYGADEPLCRALEEGKIKYSLSYNEWLTDFAELSASAERVLAGVENVDFLRKILKST